MTELKRKVTLKTKQGTAEQETSPPKRKPWWLLWLLILAVIVGVIVYLLPKNNEPLPPDPVGDGELIETPIEGNDTEKTDIGKPSEAPLKEAEVATSGEAVTEEGKAEEYSGGKSEETPKAERTESAPSSKKPILSDDIEKLALDVIRGNYGNGAERKEKLGDNYQAIQNIVNEIYRNKGM